MKGISHWIDQRSIITPNRLALIDDQRKLTYLEMSKIVNRFSGILQSTYSIKKGDRVGVLSLNSIDFIIVLFSLAKLNAVAVPLNIRLTVDELEYQLKDSGLQTLIVDNDNHTKGKELLNRTRFQLLTFKTINLAKKVENFSTRFKRR